MRQRTATAKADHTVAQHSGNAAAGDGKTTRLTRPLQAVGGIALLVIAPAATIGIAYVQLDGWALYSEEEVLGASVLHPAFRSAEHFYEPFWKSSMKQRERLDSLTETIHGTVKALEKVGINAFLESASLIGWMRHDGGQIPWDTDGDVGISVEECVASGATKSSLQAVLEPAFAVLKFACKCEEDCAGDNLRMAGRVAHRTTGVCIDIFAYAPVQKLRPWQTAPRYDGVEWWERVNDHADYTFPKQALFPLQNGSFVGSPMLLPRDPQEFLSWEYGRCLGVHPWPWRLLLYTPVSSVSRAAFVLKGAVLLAGSEGQASACCLALAGCICNFAAVKLFGSGGVSVLIMLAMSLFEFCGLALNRSAFAVSTRRLHRAATLLVIAALVFDLRGCIGQVLCGLDDFYLRPRRPKTWTLCLLGRCWDF